MNHIAGPASEGNSRNLVDRQAIVLSERIVEGLVHNLIRLRERLGGSGDERPRVIPTPVHPPHIHHDDTVVRQVLVNDNDRAVAGIPELAPLFCHKVAAILAPPFHSTPFA